MPLTEEEITRLETQIPEWSRRAFREAFERALASGHPVTVLEGREVVQLTKDGGRTVIDVLPESVTSLNPLLLDGVPLAGTGAAPLVSAPLPEPGQGQE